MNFNFHIMKENILPNWEDLNNTNGCNYITKLLFDSENEYDNIIDIIFNFVILIVKNNFFNDDDFQNTNNIAINGITIQNIN